MTAMIRTSIAAATLIGAGRDAAVEPDQQHAGEAGDQAGDRIGGDAVRGDVEAERAHAAGIVAGRLQASPKVEREA